MPFDKQKYQREWMRRYRAAHPEKFLVSGGRKSRAKKPPRKVGECVRCHQIFPSTNEFFVPLKNKRKAWTGLSSECRTCRNQRFRDHYAANRDHHVARATAYAKEHPEKKNARDMARYAATIAPQMPAWSDKKMIEAFYAIADFLSEKTGVLYQVDHIYPLKGKICSGLHVHQNMRVITALANQQKGNRIPSEFNTWKGV